MADKGHTGTLFANSATGYRRQEWRNYKFEIFSPSPGIYNPASVAADIRITTRYGQNYSANFVTPKFIEEVFTKNKRTGECAGGTYFTMPNMIVVQEVDRPTVKRTLDAMIENDEIGLYLEPLD